MFWGILLLVNALALSLLSGFMSVSGMAALFPAGGLTVILMMTGLECAKLVASGFLKANWSNPKLSLPLKAYLFLACVMIMVITDIGVFGNLMKFHLEGAAPIAGVQIKIDQIAGHIKQVQADHDRQTSRLAQLDAQIAAVLGTSKTAKDANSSQRLQNAQKKDRDLIKAALAKDEADINAMNDSLVPLKQSISDVSAKLGPLQNLADFFHWNDPKSAVYMIVIAIIAVFDPLAVFMLLSAQVSFGEWLAKRREKKAEKTRRNSPPTLLPVDLPPPPVVTEISLPGSDVEPELGSIKPIDNIAEDYTIGHGHNPPAEHDDKLLDDILDWPLVLSKPLPDTLERTQHADLLAPLAEQKARLYAAPVEQAEASAEPVQRAIVLPTAMTTIAIPPERFKSLTEAKPVDLKITMTPDRYSQSYGLTEPLRAKVDTVPLPITQDPTAEIFGGYRHPKTDRDRMLELFSRRPDFLEQVVKIVEEDFEKKPTGLFPPPSNN